MFVLRRLRSTFLGALLSVLLAVLGAAAANAGVGDDPPASADSVRILFANAAGEPSDAPYFSIAGAYPGMQPQVSTMALANQGDVAVAYDLSVRVTSPPDAPALADVLVLEVSEHDEVVYRGPLSKLRVAGSAAITPGSSVTYQMALSWPDGGESDNQFQGVSLSFDFVARSREA